MPASTQGLKQRSDGGWDVETEHGTLTAKRVVNAAGQFLNYVLCLFLESLLSGGEDQEVLGNVFLEESTPFGPFD